MKITIPTVAVIDYAAGRITTAAAEARDIARSGLRDVLDWLGEDAAAEWDAREAIERDQGGR